MRRRYGRKCRSAEVLSQKLVNDDDDDGNAMMSMMMSSQQKRRRDARLRVTNMMNERWRNEESRKTAQVETNFRLIESGESQAMYEEIVFILDGLEEENVDLDVVTESLESLTEQLDSVVVRARNLHGRIFQLLVPVVNRVVGKKNTSKKKLKLVKMIERVIMMVRSELDFMQTPLVILKTLLPFADRDDLETDTISGFGQCTVNERGGFAMETLVSLLNRGKRNVHDDEEHEKLPSEILQQLATRQSCLRETKAASVMIRRFRYELYGTKEQCNWKSLSLCLDVLEELTFPQVDRETSKKLKPLNGSETKRALESMTDLIKMICSQDMNDFKVPDTTFKWDMITKTCRVMMNLTNGDESAASCVGNRGGVNVLVKLLMPTLSAVVDRENHRTVRARSLALHIQITYRCSFTIPTGTLQSISGCGCTDCLARSCDEFSGTLCDESKAFAGKVSNCSIRDTVMYAILSRILEYLELTCCCGERE